MVTSIDSTSMYVGYGTDKNRAAELRNGYKKVFKFFDRHFGFGFVQNTAKNFKETVEKHPNTLLGGVGVPLVYSIFKTRVKNIEQDAQILKNVKLELPKIDPKWLQC